MGLTFIIEQDATLAKYFKLISLKLHENENLASQHIPDPQNPALGQATFVHTHQTLHARSKHSLFFGLCYDSFTLSESESKSEK